MVSVLRVIRLRAAPEGVKRSSRAAAWMLVPELLSLVIVALASRPNGLFGRAEVKKV